MEKNSIQTMQSLHYTIAISTQELTDSSLRLVLNKVHQFAFPVDVQYNNTYKTIQNRNREILVTTKPILDRQINELRNALLAIPGVLIVNVSKE